MKYSITIETENEEIRDSLERFATKHNLTCRVITRDDIDQLQDLLEPSDEEQILPTNVTPIQSPVQKFRRDDTPQNLYFLRRDGIVGYIGVTSRSVEQRVDQHLSRARNPLDAWILHGLEEQTLECGLIETVLGRKNAEALERELIRKFSPPYNKTHNPLPYSIRSMGGLSTFLSPVGEENVE